jgi:hypothetical protein
MGFVQSGFVPGSSARFVQEPRITRKAVYMGPHGKDKCYAIGVLRLQAMHVKVL